MVEANVTLRIPRLVLAGARAAVLAAALPAVLAVAVQLPITAIAWSAPAAMCAAADGAHHVALVVEHGDGSTVTRCVSFSGSSLTGEQVLADSGVAYQTVSFGGLSDAVCQVDGEPATFPAACWTSTSKFWALFVARSDTTWFPSSLGISTQVFHDGDSEGLRFEPQAQPIAPTTYGNCPTSTPTPKPTSKPTARPTTGPTQTPTITSRRTPAQPTPTEGAATSAGPTAISLGLSSATPAISDSSPGIAIAGSTSSSAPSVDPLAAAIGAGSAEPPTTPPSGPPVGLAIGLLLVVGLAGLALARVRTGRTGGAP